MLADFCVTIRRIKKVKVAKMHSGFHEEDSSLDCRKLYVYLLMHFLRPVAMTGGYENRAQNEKEKGFSKRMFLNYRGLNLD